MEKEINLFVPGRLCLLGEHSDWAGRYRNVNSKICKGYAIVTGIEEGIYATAKISNNFIIKNSQDEFSCKMDSYVLKKYASKGEFWSYAVGVAVVVKEQYNVGGIEINITNTTIPVKKGLSSSAAICVLVARAFNQLYNLHLNILGEMNLAYSGEIETPSRCGKLDQACAYGKKPILMEFDGDKITVKDLKIGSDFYFVFADLMASKNTVKILGDLNDCYPFAESEIDKNVHEYLGNINEKNIRNAINFLANGENEKFGKLMIEAQKEFDSMVAPACPEELSSPILHSVFNDNNIKNMCYGYKGVGSQGDGTVQFLAKSKEDQFKLKEYLIRTLKMDAYTLTIEKRSSIKKAIVPLAGNGTRMFPITKIIKKAFIPIVDSKDGIIKPTIMCILEELDQAGIENICLIIDKEDKKYYDLFFKSDINEEIRNKLSDNQLEYESKIRKIGKKLTYIYQEEKLGLGHAVSLCRDFVNNENVLLVLGDQIYKSYSNNSVTQQLLNQYEKINKLMISVCEVPLEDVSKYGILSGVCDKKSDYFFVNKMVEKPDSSIAEEKYFTLKGNEKKYYSVFGEYIITPDVFDLLDRNIKEGRKERGEYQITSVLDEVREKNGMIAFIPDGVMLDVGNVNSYKKTFSEMIK